MRRRAIEPRENWRAIVEPLGLVFHKNPDGSDYWNESACYEFTAEEIDVLEDATNALHAMCLEAVDFAISKRLYSRFGISPSMIPLIERAWNQKDASLYGRFDLAFNGVDPPKMLEYNADTPTALLEAAVIQWYWLQDFNSEADQFNSIWEGLVERWKALKSTGTLGWGHVHFASSDSIEDFMTVTMLQDTAHEAGLQTDSILMEDIGWNSELNRFVDLQNRPIECLFKLYPWEWMVQETYAEQLSSNFDKTVWIEPIWKMMLSNKAILPILWQIFPDSPYLLAAHFGEPHDLTAYVKKPLLGREGANVSVVTESGEFSTSGQYGDQPFVFQEYVDLPAFNDRRPIIGSWIIDGVSRGIGIRDSEGLVTTNLSQFVPHYFP